MKTSPDQTLNELTEDILSQQRPLPQTIKIFPGSPYPLGATVTSEGVNFALYADNATAVELCLFDSPDSTSAFITIKMIERTHHIWHIFIPDAKHGQLYGYRVHGPFAPEQGHRFNHNKVLIDPYAKAIAGTIKWSDALFGYEVGDADEDLSYSKK